MADMIQVSNLLVLLALAFIFIKFTPYPVLVALHNPVIMVLTLVILLALTTRAPKLGVLGLLYIGGLYLERNRVTLARAMSLTGSGPGPALSQDPTMPVSPSQRSVPYDWPSYASHSFKPSADCDVDGNEWSPVAPSMDHKRPPLITVPPGYATKAYLD
jgi:hypothetical protein